MIHVIPTDLARCARIALGELAADIQPDLGFQPRDMIHWQGEAGHHVTATITAVQRADDFAGGQLGTDMCVLTFELYRTWIAGQPGPGDWAEAARTAAARGGVQPKQDA